MRLFPRLLLAAATISVSTHAAALDLLDNILPAEARLCGTAALPSEARQAPSSYSFTLTSADDTPITWQVLTTAGTYAKLRTALDRPYPVIICIPAARPDAADPAVPLYADWFLAIDPGASGVSVSSQ